MTPNGPRARAPLLLRSPERSRESARGPATRFFLWCAGTDPEHLATATDTTRQAGLGALVCIPPLLAFPAALVALRIHGLDVGVQVLAATIWACVVFAFDRYVVTSLPKSESVARDLLRPSFLVRLLLAATVGVAVAHPLLLLFFHDAVDARLDRERTGRTAPATESFREERRGLEGRLRDLSRESDARDADLRRARDLLTAEIVGEVRSDVTTGRTGDGPAAAARRAELEWLERRHASWSLDAERRRSELVSDLATTKAAENRAHREASVVRDDLSERTRVVSVLVREDPALRTAWWFLLFLFVFVDTLPTLFKALTPRGLYDELVELEQGALRTRARARTELGGRTVERERAAFESLEGEHRRAARRAWAEDLGTDDGRTDPGGRRRPRRRQRRRR